MNNIHEGSKQYGLDINDNMMSHNSNVDNPVSFKTYDIKIKFSRLSVIFDLCQK